MNEACTPTIPIIDTEPKPEVFFEHTQEGLLLTLPTINQSFDVEDTPFRVHSQATTYQKDAVIRTATGMHFLEDGLSCTLGWETHIDGEWQSINELPQFTLAQMSEYSDGQAFDLLQRGLLTLPTTQEQITTTQAEILVRELAKLEMKRCNTPLDDESYYSIVMTQRAYFVQCLKLYRKLHPELEGEEYKEQLERFLNRDVTNIIYDQDHTPHVAGYPLIKNKDHDDQYLFAIQRHRRGAEGALTWQSFNEVMPEDVFEQYCTAAQELGLNVISVRTDDGGSHHQVYFDGFLLTSYTLEAAIIAANEIVAKLQLPENPGYQDNTQNTPIKI